MSDPTTVDAAQLFEFIGGADLAVVLISVHPIHAFSPTLSQQLSRNHKGIALGIVDLRELIFTNGAALRFIHQGLQACGAPTFLGVLPGYCLFRRGEMLAWDTGLPTFADIEAIARSALLGAIWSGVSRDAAFIGQALRVAAEQVAAYRVAVRFRYAASEVRAEREAAGPSRPRPVDELFWAYQMLGVLPTATDQEVHQAWRRRRMEHHPDAVAGNPEEFARRSQISADINRARDIIVNYRAAYTRGSYAKAS